MFQDQGDIEGLFRVGCPAVIHTNPGERDEKRYSTVVRGWYQGSYVLLDKPITEETSAPFAKSQRCLVRFLSEGKACGFPCTLLKSGEAASPYLRVSWPRKIECVGIRKHERVEIHVPCKITSQDHDGLEGQTVDVSGGGCGVWTKARIAPETPLQLSFHLPDGSAVVGARATVCSARAAGKGFFLGCKFEEEEEARTTCDFFVTTTLERMRGETDEKRAVLLESEDVRSDSTREKLEAKGYRVITASCIVDAFFSLRMASPDCFWLGAEQGELSALDICRLVRATRGFESLPIYVIGGHDTELMSGLKKMDVVYVASIEVMDNVLA